MATSREQVVAQMGIPAVAQIHQALAQAQLHRLDQMQKMHKGSERQ